VSPPGVLFWAYYHSGGRRAPDDDHAGDRILLTFAADALPPGVLGLLVAAVLGSTMAVFSGGVNAAATCCCVDLLATPGEPADPARTVRRARWLTIGFGLGSIGLAFVASAIGGLVKESVGVVGLVEGPLLGLFSLAIFSRAADARAAATGLAVGLAAMLYVGVGNALCPTAGEQAGTGCAFLAPGGFVLSIFWTAAAGAAITFVVGEAAGRCRRRRAAPPRAAGSTAPAVDREPFLQARLQDLAF